MEVANSAKWRQKERKEARRRVQLSGALDKSLGRKTAPVLGERFTIRALRVPVAGIKI